MSISNILGVDGKIVSGVLPNPYPFPVAASGLGAVLAVSNDALTLPMTNVGNIGCANIAAPFGSILAFNSDLIGGGVTANLGILPAGNLTLKGAQTKGSLLVGDGASTKELVVGTNGLVLKCNSAQPLGVEWAVDGGGGGTLTGVSAGPNITIDSITNPLIPAISVSNPLDAVLNLGTQNITGTSGSLTLTDNAVPAINTMVLTDNTLNFTDTGNGAVATLNADSGLVIKPLPLTASGTELTYSKLEMIELDGAGSTSSRLIDTTASTSYDRMRFETPTGLFTDNEKECSLSQSFNTTEYNDPVSTIQTFTRSDADATQGRFRVLYNESTIPIVNNSAITITPSQAELSQNVSNLTGANATQITTNASALAIFTNKNILFTSQNIDSDGTRLELTTPNATTASPMLLLVSTSAAIGNTNGTAVIKTIKNGRNAQTGDIIMSQQFNALNFNGGNVQYGGIECRVSTSTAGDTDGSLDFYNTINGVLQRTFTMNGADNENNTFRPLDLNGNLLKTSTGDLLIQSLASTGTGNLSVQAKGHSQFGGETGFTNLYNTNGNITMNAGGATSDLEFNCPNWESATAGGSSGNYLRIKLNGVYYKIVLEND